MAILTVAKAGMLVAYKFGSGLVVARRSDGSWSAPSALVSFGLGWGAQVSLLSVKGFRFSICFPIREKVKLAQLSNMQLTTGKKYEYAT